ncbi:hypothetical protein [Brumimicrobium salinarum]|nr:hypothetical protein [Brumimicrobium salinarum]
MRFHFILLFFVLLISCTNEKSNIDNVKEQLMDGSWRLVESEQPFKRFHSGLKFSQDGQVFNVDSQGRIVVPLHERMFYIASDTLKLIDYKYESKFLETNGTELLLIEELNEEELVLNIIYPIGPNKLTFQKQK